MEYPSRQFGATRKGLPELCYEDIKPALELQGGLRDRHIGPHVIPAKLVLREGGGAGIH
jgi:hypothetical protein